MPAYSPVFPFLLLARLCGGRRLCGLELCGGHVRVTVVSGPVQVRPRFEPKVQSNQSLDLNLLKRVRSTFKLTRTFGPQVQSGSNPGPRSAEPDFGQSMHLW